MVLISLCFIILFIFLCRVGLVTDIYFPFYFLIAYYNSFLGTCCLPFVISNNFSTHFGMFFLPRCDGFPMLAVPQYALSWPDLLVSDMCLLLENIPHVSEPNSDTTISLLFSSGVCLISDVFYFYFFLFNPPTARFN